MRVTTDFEYLDKVFVLPRASVPSGGYGFTRNSTELLTAQRRRLWGSATLGWGSFYDGDRKDLALGAGWKAALPLCLGMAYEQNHVSLPTGEFTTRLTRLNANILFSPNITLHTLLQYDALSESLRWQSRSRWILRPGNEVLFVWNARVDYSLERFELAESAARLKLRFIHRF